MDPKTKELVEAAEARANAATPGPWSNKWDDAVSDDFDGQVAVKSDALGVPLDGIVIGLIWYNGLNVACTRETAEFVAHARADVPALCAIVREQAARLGSFSSALHDAIQLAVEMLPYVDEYFQQKWEYPSDLAKLQRRQTLLADATLSVDELRRALERAEKEKP